MTTFNSAFDWDSNIPSAMSSLDENDFLLLLQKQFPSVNAAPIDPGVIAKAKPDVAADPQSLSKFQLPNTTSPLSTDSSPSPPSANDDSVSFNGSDGHNTAGQSKQASPPADEDHHKRKVSADDFDDEINGQPSAKSQHMDAKSRKTIQSRRKSTGAEKGQDESRLLKRKEQNRAAQRAFRERKEKHVKDLEDKVAQLEAKTESQATENDNLRDMLSRLQNENVALKQAAFTFSVPSTSASAAAEPSRDPSRSSSDSLNLFANSSSSTAGPSRAPGSAHSSVATASSHNSPASLFEGFEGYPVTNPDAPSASNPTPASSASANASTSAQDLETMAYFGSPGPFTTIASNPMFTSYRDPIQSLNAFASFAGWDGDVNMPGPSSSNDVTNTSLEDLFGDQFAGLVPFSGDFGTGESKGSPSTSSANHVVSTIGNHKLPSPNDHANGNCCPNTKEDVEHMIANGPKGTFGESPMLVPPTEEKSPSAPSHSRQTSRGNSYDATYQQQLNNSTDPKQFCDNFNIDELCLEMQRKAKCSGSHAAAATACA